MCVCVCVHVCIYRYICIYGMYIVCACVEHLYTMEMLETNVCVCVM